MSRRALFVLAMLMSAGASIALAQSSPKYQVTDAGVVATSGETSSATYTATVTGGEGAPANAASSPRFAAVLGAGNPDPVDAEEVFATGFEATR